MMKILKSLLLLTFLINSLLFANEKINRKLICLYNSLNKEDSYYNEIHQNLEVILNYYGYYCDYYDLNNLPENIDEYSGVVYWGTYNKCKSSENFYNWLIKAKKLKKKLLLIGELPDKNSKKVNKILKEKFGFYFHGYWYNNSENIDIVKKSKIFDFESPLNQLTVKDFNDIKIVNKKIKPLLILKYRDNDLELFSYPVFIAQWGAFSLASKIVYINEKTDVKRWLINPFKFIEMIFYTNYPIPETTTINGKRILYIHLDGDGVNSKSEVIPGKICGEVWYEKIGKGFPEFKTGVSFIAGDLDPDFAGNERAQQIAKKIFALPNIEPASHTYTHPLSWKEALVAYKKKNEKILTGQYGHIKAIREKSGEVNHYFEIIGSIKYLNQFAPKNKKIKTLYWSGDCMPTKKDLKMVNKYNLLAFNGGDTFFDLKHNSYLYVTPLGRDVNGLKQIYSSGSNENVYTDLWKDNYWAFSGVIETFKKTGYPIRIKPINLYYHFYSVEKIASYKALVKIYKYLRKIKKRLINIFPSKFIEIAKNFYTVRIYKTGKKHFKIENAKFLKEFRLAGKRKIKILKNIKSVHYNKKLNVTYITLGNNSYGELIVY